ncbi:hypothetical protein HYX58_04785 [Candidatus Dependentiae bacterium]|nr:hypothetical protein [Candidatus Dependentiae bacterium]
MIRKALLITFFVQASIYANPVKPTSNDPDIDVLEMVADAHTIIKNSYGPEALPINPNLEGTLWGLGKVFACLKAGRADVPTFYKMGCPDIIKSAKQTEK